MCVVAGASGHCVSIYKFLEQRQETKWLFLD